MVRGLFWLSLLMIIAGLAWLGAKEYQKVEQYQQWAEQFDKAKYDLYSVLGQKGDRITWGKASAQGIVEMRSFSLQEVEGIYLLIDNEVFTESSLPEKGNPAIQFRLKQDDTVINVPFTEIALAAQWTQYLVELAPS